MNLPHYIRDEEPPKDEMVIAEAVTNAPYVINDDVVVIDGTATTNHIGETRHALAPARTATVTPVRLDESNCPAVEPRQTVVICDQEEGVRAAEVRNSIATTSFDRWMAGLGSAVGLGGGALGGVLLLTSVHNFQFDWMRAALGGTTSFAAGTMMAMLAFNWITKWQLNRKNQPLESAGLPGTVRQWLSFSQGSVRDWSVMSLLVLFLMVAVGVGWLSIRMLPGSGMNVLVGIGIALLGLALTSSLAEVPKVALNNDAPDESAQEEAVIDIKEA